MKLFSFLFTSTIGRKWLMGLTGLFLISFLLVHCGVNACIFFNDGGETFNMAADFMSTNWIIRTMEFVLFAGLLLHIFQGLYLWKFNTDARKKRYSVSGGSANSTWYSRSMGILGTLLLLFLVVHLKDFWITSRFTEVITSGEKNAVPRNEGNICQSYCCGYLCAGMYISAVSFTSWFSECISDLGY
jgi:succinate dehydrogenase / fumarate reductase cytochrome b subunit